MEKLRLCFSGKNADPYNPFQFGACPIKDMRRLLSKLAISYATISNLNTMSHLGLKSSRSIRATSMRSNLPWRHTKGPSAAIYRTLCRTSSDITNRPSSCTSNRRSLQNLSRPSIDIRRNIISKLRNIFKLILILILSLRWRGLVVVGLRSPTSLFLLLEVLLARLHIATSPRVGLLVLIRLRLGVPVVLRLGRACQRNNANDEGRALDQKLCTDLARHECLSEQCMTSDVMHDADGDAFGERAPRCVASLDLKNRERCLSWGERFLSTPPVDKAVRFG